MPFTFPPPFRSTPPPPMWPIYICILAQPKPSLLLIFFFYCGEVHIKFTILIIVKCAVQFKYIQNVVTIHTLHICNSFHLVAIKHYSPSSLNLTPGDYNSTFRLWFWIKVPHVSGITKCLSFNDWHFSWYNNPRVYPCCSISHNFFLF